MVEEAIVSAISLWIINVYNSFMSLLPSWGQKSIETFLLVFLVFVYAVIIWKFYRFIARKNIIELNLNKYNRSQHPFFTKVMAGFFYFVEYIIILPFLIFIWFSVFTLFLVLLTEGRSTEQILLISAVIISAVRMTAYYSEDLSKDLAKMLPFTLLAVSILDSGSFNIESIVGHLAALPSFLGNVFIYFLFIAGLEIVLRFFDFIFSLFGFEEVPIEESIE